MREEIDEILLSPIRTRRGARSCCSATSARGPSPNGEVILGFTTDDLPALLERVRTAGGRITAPIKEMPELKIRVAFATDPEGHLAELVQVVA